MDHAFGQGGTYSLGVEEELMLVDARTRKLAPIATDVLAGAGLPERAAGHEAYSNQIELRSPPSSGAAEATAALARGREAAGRAARAAGGALLAAGLHPTADLGDAPLVDSERYRRVLESMRGLIQRTPEGALHVHIGMPDADAAIRAFNGLRGWLPLLMALAASSPLWFGRDSGLASARWAIVRAFPSRGIPRPLRDLDDYRQALADSEAGGGPSDYTMIWWDVRLHPRFGTVEIRELDVQSRLDDTVALAALAHGLARHEAESGGEPAPTEAIEWSAFRAARDGLEAEVLCEGRLRPVAEAARLAVERAQPHLRDGALSGIDRIVREGNAAQRQRAAFARGGADAVLDLLLDETAASAAGA